MPTRFRVLMLLLSAAALPMTVGCLSLGGKTTYVTESSADSERISALETRVGILEQAVLHAAPATNGATIQ
jgi:hypothetical protein